MRMKAVEDCRLLANIVAKVGEGRFGRNNRIGSSKSLNQPCVSRADLESMLLPRTRKIFLQQYRPVADARVAGPSVRNLIKFRRQSQARLTVVGGATVAHVRRPLPRKAAVAADMVWCLRLTHSGPLTARQVASFRANNCLAFAAQSITSSATDRGSGAT